MKFFLFYLPSAIQRVIKFHAVCAAVVQILWDFDVNTLSVSDWDTLGSLPFLFSQLTICIIQL